MNKTIPVLLVALLTACSAPSHLNQAEPEKPVGKRGGKEPMEGDYWALRYTYPTLEFDSRWLREAKVQHDNTRVAKPAGVIQALRDQGDEPNGGGNLPVDQFTSLGPSPLNGGFGHVAGRVNAIISHPTNTAIAYIGSDGGGVWKTTNCCDENTTWTSLMDDPMFNSIAIGDLHFDPNDPETVYAGTGDLRYGSYSFGASGLLRTRDAGATWEILGEDVFNPVYGQPPGVFPQYQAIGKVRVDPNDSTNIVVGTKTGIFISYDDGANWTGPCLTNGFTDQRQDTTGLELFDNGATTGIMAAIGTRGAPTPVQPDLSENGANGVYKGTLPASGCPTDWTLVNSGWPAGTGGGLPYPANPVGRIDLAVSPSNPDVIYAEGGNANTLAMLGVWRSSDGGDTWVQQATFGDLGGCAGGGGQAWYDAGVTVDPNNPDVIFLSDIDLYRSSNGADTFTNITCGYGAGMPFPSDDVHVDQHARTFVGGTSNRLLIGNDGGVYYTDNANVANPRDMIFTQLNDTLNIIEFYSGDITGNFNTSDSPGVIGGAQDNGTSVHVWSGGETVEPALWQEIWGGDGIYARIEPVNEQRWYAESQRGNLGISQSGPLGPYSGVAEPWGGERRGFLFPFEIHKHDCPPSGCQNLVAGSYRVWETINGGISGSDWYANSPDLTKGVLADRSIINQLAFAISDKSIVIVGTNDGNVQYGFNMGQGVANSATWVDVTGGNTVLPNRPILDVYTDPAVPTTGYAAVGGFDQNTPGQPGHVFRVVCNADCSSFEWQNKSGNLPNIPVDSIAVNPRNPKQVFAGTDWGLYFTDDIDTENPSWMRFNDGLPSVMIWDMAVDAGFTTLAVFTRSRGAFVWPLPEAPLNVKYGFE